MAGNSNNNSYAAKYLKTLTNPFLRDSSSEKLHTIRQYQLC